jgi:hypothetical protein
MARALTVDPGLEFDAVVGRRNENGEDTFFIQASGGPRTLTAGFRPPARRSLGRRSIIANIEADFFTRPACADAEFVAERGGLLVLGGRSFAQRV